MSSFLHLIVFFLRNVKLCKVFGKSRVQMSTQKATAMADVTPPLVHDGTHP